MVRTFLDKKYIIPTDLASPTKICKMVVPALDAKVNKCLKKKKERKHLFQFKS